MAQDPVPRASRGPRASGRSANQSASQAAGQGVSHGANHVRYLAVLAFGAFALPVLATMLERAGGPPAPSGVTALLLAVVLIIAILVDRPRDPGEARGMERRRPLASEDAEDADAGL